MPDFNISWRAIVAVCFLSGIYPMRTASSMAMPKIRKMLTLILLMLKLRMEAAITPNGKRFDFDFKRIGKVLFYKFFPLKKNPIGTADVCYVKVFIINGQRCMIFGYGTVRQNNIRLRSSAQCICPI
jgi:hypothetical protein